MLKDLYEDLPPGNKSGPEVGKMVRVASLLERYIGTFRKPLLHGGPKLSSHRWPPSFSIDSGRTLYKFLQGHPIGNLTLYLAYSHEMVGPLATDEPIHLSAVECERHTAE
jgi:hypothetical protein